MPLNGADASHLRALAHKLVPIVQLGKEGVTDALAVATARALLDHELIKVKILAEAPVDRHEAAEALAAATDSDVAQVIGRIVVLYRPSPRDPQIKLPNAGAGGRAAKARGGAEGPPAKKPKKKSGVGNRPKHKKRTIGRGSRAPKAEAAPRATKLAPRPRRDEERFPGAREAGRSGGRGAAREAGRDGGPSAAREADRAPTRERRNERGPARYGREERAPARFGPPDRAPSAARHEERGPSRFGGGGERGPSAGRSERGPSRFGGGAGGGGGERAPSAGRSERGPSRFGAGGGERGPSRFAGGERPSRSAGGGEGGESKRPAEAGKGERRGPSRGGRAKR